MKKLLVIMFVFCFMNLTACGNTMSGLGKDLEKMGESIQKEFEDEKSDEDKD